MGPSSLKWRPSGKAFFFPFFFSGEFVLENGGMFFCSNENPGGRWNELQNMSKLGGLFVPRKGDVLTFRV